MHSVSTQRHLYRMSWVFRLSKSYIVGGKGQPSGRLLGGKSVEYVCSLHYMLGMISSKY